MIGCPGFKGHLVNMQVRATQQELQIQKQLLLLSVCCVTVSPFDSDNDPARKPVPHLLTDEQTDLTELTSEVTQLAHFQARMPIQVWLQILGSLYCFTRVKVI